MPKKQLTNELGDPKKEYAFKSKNNKLFEKLAKDTHFTHEEVQSLAVIHKAIVETLGPIRASKFRDVMHSGFDFTENIRHRLVHKVFLAVDTKSDVKITMDEWITGLSVMLNGKIDERIQFAYKVYNWLGTNVLKKEEIFAIMKGCIIKQQPTENLDGSVRDMVELLIKKMDIDRKGERSEDEFANVAKINPFYLESMGPVFPSRAARYAFLNTFTDKEILY